MEKRDATPSPPGLVSPEDGGLWMKLVSSPVAASPPAVIARYYSVMDDEGADDVFILPPSPPPPPPASSAPLLPPEGSTDGAAINSSVTFSNGASDATAAEDNPSGLDWLRGEKQLMAAQVETAATAQTSEESMDDKNFAPATDGRPAPVEGSGSLREACHEGFDEEPEDTVTLSEGRGEDPNQTPADTEETSDTEGGKDTNQTVEDAVDAETSGLTLDQTCESSELHKNKMDSETVQVPDNPGDMTDDDQEHVDTSSLTYNLIKNGWLRRESETQVLPVSVSGDSEEAVAEADDGDGSRKIASDIQHGEKLLQRLQLVQQRQDGHTSEGGSTGQQEDEERAGVEDLTAGEGDLTPQCKDSETKASMSTENSDDEHSESWGPPHSSPINAHEASRAAPPARHRFSAAETSVEIQKAAQGTQNLQRAGGVFNLADNPDVLEIPFQTNILLEPFPSGAGRDQRSDWQFSEQKMQKEISQEIQRELVLVNQGKIPGGYSKGEVRQLKETKLLFEAFQQVTAEGPRHRNPPTGHVYPSVLERTRSLEMFSIKSCPVSRAHSLRLCKSTTLEREKSPESLRSRSPTAGSREKTRLSPYPKQVHMHRSMDSLSRDVSASAVDRRTKGREADVGQSSPILKENPFVKLRPALALQPEVEKDIREAKQREEELRRQRSALYGESRTDSSEEEKSRLAKTLRPDVRQQSTGKLERVWPPPSKRDQMKSEQTQQEPRGHRAAGQKAPLWQRWESGLINGQPPQDHN